MKKIALKITTIAALITLVACSKKEIDVNNTPNLIIQTGIKSSDTSLPATANFQLNDKIGLFAFMRHDNNTPAVELYMLTSGYKFNNVESNVIENGELNMSKSLHLPDDPKFIDMFAYYPFYNKNVVSNANTPISLPVLKNQSIDADFKKSAALVAMTHEINDKTVQPIKLSFRHIHAKLNFKFKIGDGFNNIEEIKKLKLTVKGVPANVSYSIANDKTTVDFNNTIDIKPNGELVVNAQNNNILIGLSVIVPTNIYDDENPLLIYIDNYPIKYTQKLTTTIERGKFYDITYTLKKNSEHMTAEITGWTSGDTVDVDAKSSN